jgi:hypothetical protein
MTMWSRNNWKHFIKRKNANKIIFDVSVEPVMLIKFAPASIARAFAKSVFPVLGGSKSKTPLQGWKRSTKSNS